MNLRYLTPIILFLISCNSTQKLQHQFVPTFTTSNNTTHNIKPGQEYTFGYLEVLENRKKASTKTILLPVYIFKSRSKNPKPDPIIYTVGGPGATTMPSAQYMNYYKYLDDRDFILIEQRGNFYAKPHLDCPEWSKAVFQSNLPDFNEKNYDSLFESAIKDCRKRLIEKGVDLDAYNTKQIAEDIHDLTSVLELEEYNLLTMSYSTKIAQVLLRDHPAKIRSVVMDSPLPLEVRYDEESVDNLLFAVRELLSDCESQASCAEAYPNLEQRFLSFLRNKTKNPLQVEVVNPKSNEVEVVYLKGEDLITVFTSASTTDVTNIPFEINKLLSNDLTSVKKQLSNLFAEPGPSDGQGLRLSVWCAEEYPFSSQKIINSELKNHPETKGLSPAVFGEEICKIWSVKKAKNIEKKAIKSDLPVLLINGQYDEITPVKWAKSMRKNLIDSHHLIFDGWKHGPTTNWVNQCAMQAANDFFNNPTIKPNPECLSEIRNFKFRTE